jgi:hypothetical protein
VKSQPRRRSTQFLALAVIITLMPLPVLAGESTQPTPAKQTLSATAAKVVAREVAKDAMQAAEIGATAVKPAAFTTSGARMAARAGQEGMPGERSGSFFKTGAGIAVMAVLGLGVGYALYSAKHDRVRSPGK